jgi:hypothetical protein
MSDIRILKGYGFEETSSIMMSDGQRFKVLLKGKMNK